MISCFKIFLFFTLLNYISGDYELTVLHTNDVHARIEESNKYGGLCESNQSVNCFGGVARRHTAVEALRKANKNVILLDGGDRFQGTIWYNIYKGQATVRFMNYTKYDAMAVGNHEFDMGPSVLWLFIKSANFPLLASNIDLSAATHPKDVTIEKSTVITRDKKRIGVIGYITAETSWLSNPGPEIKFNDVIDSVRKEAVRLKSTGVDILIALGHAGIETDKKIAQLVNEIDLVVGGHSNTFLYNGKPPSNDKSEGPYPIKYTRSDGTTALVVQDFAYGKYLGNLTVAFDDKGNVKSWNGNPILLSDSAYKQDAKVLAMVKDMDDEVLKQRNLSIGRSLVYLDGDRRSCRLQECNLGNLFADALVKTVQSAPDESRWATVALGMWNAGGIRSSIDKTRKEFITYEDIVTVSPFGNTADIIELKGNDLLAAFEHSASGLEKGGGRFLQVAGFQVMYNKNKPVGKRLVELKALCVECRIPKYEKVDAKKIYKVITSNYLVNGGDGYAMLKNALTHHSGNSAVDALQNYITRESPLSPAVEGRITFVTDNNQCNAETHSKNFFVFTFLAAIAAIVIS